jgi:hypothetical protein
MERAHQLRENAIRCLRLSGSINRPDDVAWLEALAEESTKAAEQLEAEDVAGVAGRHLSAWIAEDSRGEAHGGPGAFEGSGTLTYRDTELGSDTLPDRRRSGRRDDVSSILIPLLRDDCITSLSGEPYDHNPDQLNASRGIIIWTFISAAVWVPLLWWVL